MAVLIKRYANRKLYDTEASRYITLRGISELVRAGKEVRVVDNESGEDITALILSQIVVEGQKQGREHGMLSHTVLTELIQKGSGALFNIVRRSVDDVRDNLSDVREGVRRWVDRQAEQVPFERPEPNTRLKAYIVEVRRTSKGPQIVVSRTHPGLIKRLFELEVPEIADGVVEIKACAREPGHRTKIAVWSNDSTWSNVTRAPKAISRHSIDSAVSAGKRLRPKPSAPCATWPTSCCVFMRNENSSAAMRSQSTRRGSRSLKTVFHLF